MSTRILLAGLLGVILGVSPLRAQLDPESDKPYTLQIVLHMSKQNRLLTDLFRERVERELVDSLRASFGDLVRVELVRDHPRLTEVLDQGLQKALDGWRERSAIKTQFVLIDYSGVYYEIQSRQHDGATGLPSRVVRQERTRDRDFVAKAAALLVERDFGLMGTIEGTTTPGKVRVLLKGGARKGEPISRWIKKDDVFEIIQMASSGAEGRRMPFSVLRVVEPPADNGDGSCVCQLFQDREAPLPEGPGIEGYRCLKLGTTRAHLRILITRPGAEAQRMPVLIRRYAFQGEDATMVRSETDDRGTYDSQKTGKIDAFNQLAFISVDLGQNRYIRVPVPLLTDPIQYVVIPVSVRSEAEDLRKLRLEDWIRRVSDSYQLQTSFFKSLKELEAQPDRMAEVISNANAALDRAGRDYASLNEERIKMNQEGFGNLNPNAWAQAENLLLRIDKRSVELKQYIASLSQIEAQKNDPKRQKVLQEIKRAELLERDAEYGRAIAIYKQVLLEGVDVTGLPKKIADLEAAWIPKNPQHQEARNFIYDVWGGLKTEDLLKFHPKAAEAFKTCSDVGDLIGPRRLLDLTVQHGTRMQKEAADLKPELQIDDEKDLQRIKEISSKLGDLTKEIEVYLKTKGAG